LSNYNYCSVYVKKLTYLNIAHMSGKKHLAKLLLVLVRS